MARVYFNSGEIREGSKGTIKRSIRRAMEYNHGKPASVWYGNRPMLKYKFTPFSHEEIKKYWEV